MEGAGGGGGGGWKKELLPRASVVASLETPTTPYSSINMLKLFDATTSAQRPAPPHSDYTRQEKKKCGQACSAGRAAFESSRCDEFALQRVVCGVYGFTVMCMKCNKLAAYSRCHCTMVGV